MWMRRSVMGKRARASSGSIEFTPEVVQKRLQGDDVGGQPAGRLGDRVSVEVRRREGLVEPCPAPVPGLKLGQRQAAFDLDHARPEELRGGGVESAVALEVEAHLDPADARVVPGLVVGLGVPVVELDDALRAAGVEAAEPGRQSLAEAGRQRLKELCRGQSAAGSHWHRTNIAGLLGSSAVAYIPTVIENEGGNRERAFDIYSRLLRD